MTNVFEIMKQVARLLALEEKKRDTLRQLILAVALKDKTLTTHDYDVLIASVDYAMGFKKHYRRKPTHFRKSDFWPVRIDGNGTVREVAGSKVLDRDVRLSDYYAIESIREAANEAT